MSTKNLLDRQINIFIKKEGTAPTNIKMGIDLFNSLLEDCGQDFTNLNALATIYSDIPIEPIYKANTITNKLIILN